MYTADKTLVAQFVQLHPVKKEDIFLLFMQITILSRKIRKLSKFLNSEKVNENQVSF